MRRIAEDTAGQDMIEYALMAGLLVTTAGFFLPAVATSIGTVFSQIGSTLASAASQG
jgi:Flp pilus assembly pilin Flp